MIYRLRTVFRRIFRTEYKWISVTTVELIVDRISHTFLKVHMTNRKVIRWFSNNRIDNIYIKRIIQIIV